MAASLNAPGPPPAPHAPPPAYQSDPGYVNANNTYNQQETDLQAFLNANRSQALIQFGAPSLLHGLGFNVDPNTASAAAANPYSIYALLGKGRDEATRGITNNLAARGLLHSGDYGFLNGKNAQNYGQGLYTAEQQLLAALSGQYQSYLQQHSANQQARDSAQQQAYQWYLANPPPATSQDALYGLGTGGAQGDAAAALARLLSPTTLLRTLDDRQWRDAGGSSTPPPAAPAPAPSPGPAPIGNLTNLLK